MTWTRALTYVGIWAVLSAYYVIVEHEPFPVAESGGPSAAPQVRLLPFGAADVTAIDLRARGLHARFARRDEQWRVVAPAGREVPGDLVAAIVSAVTEPATMEVVGSSDEPGTDFGLGHPAAQLTFHLANGTATRVLLGARNPSQTAVYARREGAPEIVLMGLNVQYYVGLVMEALGRPLA